MTDDIYVLIEHIQGHVQDINSLMLTAAHEAVANTDGQVVALLLASEHEALVEGIHADRLLLYEDPGFGDFIPDAYVAVLADLIDRESPRLVLLGETTVGADIAGRVSVKSGVPVVGNCRQINSEDGGLSYTTSLCGGKIMASGKLPDTTTLVCMIPGGYKIEEPEQKGEISIENQAIPAMEPSPVKIKAYIEPEVGAIDISSERILIAVGRGIQREDNLEVATELADLIGGKLCASRPVVDQGWLPTSQMVGKSGKAVKPELYLALGISGAPEHVEGIVDSELVVAVNTDPDAPIFDVSDFGVEMDMLDLIPALIDKIQAN
jgi:electron transfer flavoprotein alpha subunit